MGPIDRLLRTDGPIADRKEQGQKVQATRTFVRKRTSTEGPIRKGSKSASRRKHA